MSALAWFRLLCFVSGVSLLLLASGRTEEKPKGKKYALLIGVKEYKGEGFGLLKYPERDVEELKKILDKAGYQTRLLTTVEGKKDKSNAPTTANIRKEFAALIKGRARGDTILLALCGHGLQIDVKDPKGEKEPLSYGYFCPSDADLTGITYSSGYSDHLILVTELFEKMGECRATNKLVFMDACRNEISVKAKSRNVDFDSMKVPKGVAVLFSCSKQQRAWEHDDLKHGVFFHYVLEGLRGRASNDRGEVRWSNLTEYVTERVGEEVPKLLGDGAKQTPHGAQNFEGRSPALIVGDGTKNLRNSLDMRLVRIPAGKFTMGSPKAQRKPFLDSIGIAKTRQLFADWISQETEHTVEINKHFLMGAHEVTQKQFRTLMDNPSYFRKRGGGKDLVKGLAETDLDDFPVENVTWHQAVEFCKKLSEQEAEKKAGRVYRLPTEAEWEYACRAGTKTAFHFGDELTMKQSNHGFIVGEKEVPGRPMKVGSFPANAFGLYDMHGNVWEWCEDWYDRKAYGRGDSKDPAGPKSGEERAMRGGAWNRLDRYCRSAHRSAQEPDRGANSVGFRVVCEEK